MKTLVLTNAKLMSYERRSDSVSGNTSYFLWFSNGTETVAGKTASDKPCGNVVTNFRDGRICNVAYHVTRAGNTVIDRIIE